MRRDRFGLVWFVLLACAVVACDDDDTPRPTATPTSVATATATLPPSATATTAATNTQQPSATATAIPTPTNTPSIVDELRATGLGDYLNGVGPSSMQPNGVWDDYRFDPADEAAICLRGGEYRVEVHHGAANKVLLYLEGGGACWNHQTCWVSPLAKDNATPFFGAGIFEFDNPDNPFQDWDVVYAPYCDGSVFGGDNIVDYQGNHTYHHGLQNLSAAVALMRDQFPDPEQIAVAGSSAGGYGTYSGYGVTRIAYPTAPIVVLNDSGPGVQNLDDPAAIQDRLTNWQFGQYIPGTCPRCEMQITYLTEWGLERDATLRVGYFSYLQDNVIRGFLGLSPEAFEALLRQVTDDVRSRQPERFKRFFLQGGQHTILELPAFNTVEIDGTMLRAWTADLLTNGPAWQDLIEDAP